MIIVAITQDICNNLCILPPSHKFDEIGEVIFHNNPRAELDTNLTNFDYHLDFTQDINILHKHLKRTYYYHRPRITKKEQYLKTSLFNSLRPNALQMPTLYSATAVSDPSSSIDLAPIGIPKCDKLVIKPTSGARGSNQLVVPSNMLQTLLKQARLQDLTLGDVKVKFPDIIITEGSDMESKILQQPENFVVTEFVNIDKEWRLLVSGNNVYCRERAITEGEYPQSNLNTEVYHNIPVVEYKPLEESSIRGEIRDTIKKYVDFVDLPIGSLDLYRDTDGQWGIFEYSTQFAFHGADPSFIRQIHLDGIEFIINRIGEIK